MPPDPDATIYTPLAARIVAHLEAGRLQIALDAADAALTDCPDNERVILLCMKGNALVTLGNPLEALRVATTAREAALRQASPLLVAEAGLALTFALQSLEEHSRAIDIASECEHIAREQDDHELIARSLRTLGISYSVLGRHEQAIELLKAVITMLEQHARTPERLFHARYSLITAHSRAMATSHATDNEKRQQYRELHEQWRDFAADVAGRKLTRLQAMSQGNAGIAARYAGDLDIALASLQQTLKLQYELGLRGHCAVTECHYGAALHSLGRADEAVASFKRAIDLLKDGNPRELVSAWEELALIYEAMDDARAALNALKQARTLEKKLHDDTALVAAARHEQKAEIARLSDQWTRLAAEDALTGLANRRAFDRQLQAMANAASAGNAGTHFALALFDLDHFKQINDVHGHAAGDAVLRRFAQLLATGRRASDLAARIGGEEFALLLVSDAASQAVSVVDRILDSVRCEPWSQLASRLKVTASCGVACSPEFPAASRTPELLLAAADRRLYLAKRDGRDRVVVQG